MIGKSLFADFELPLIEIIRDLVAQEIQQSRQNKSFAS